MTPARVIFNQKMVFVYYSEQYFSRFSFKISHPYLKHNNTKKERKLNLNGVEGGM